MRTINIESIMNPENKELAKPGTKREIDFIRRSERVEIESDKDYFYVRNWLAGNKIPCDTIKIVKKHVKKDLKIEDIKEFRRRNLEKARAARRKKGAKNEKTHEEQRRNETEDARSDAT